MSTETLRMKYPLKRAKIVKKTVKTLLPYVIIIPVLLVLFIYSILSWNPEIQIAASALLFVLTVIAGLVLWYQIVYFRKYFYDLTDEGLVVAKGVFSTRETTVPLNKIQDIYLDQDILDRIFSLWDLHISSASGISGAEAHIDGIGRADGMAMRNLLLGETASRPHKEGADVKTYKPSKKGIAMIFLGALFSSLFVLLFLPELLIIVPFTVIFAILEFRVLRYELRDEGVYIRKGFFTPRESLFLYRNIQDVEESYDIISGILDLRTLTMKTMTSLSAIDARMQYLNSTDSEHIRGEILKRGRASRKDSVKLEDVSGDAAGAEAVIPDTDDGLGSPYKNHFFKSLLYSGASTFIVVVSFMVLLLIMVFLINPMFILIPLILVFPLVFILFGMAVNTLILYLSYSYELSPQSVRIRRGILNVQRREIDYDKMQDLVLNVSLPQSFAGLANLNFETGSKEMVQQGKSSTIASTSTPVESIPELTVEDAKTLKNRIAGCMGISLSGLWTDPLVNKIPLESIKPVKKTLWWLIYLTVILIVLVILPPVPRWGLQIYFVIFSVVLLALKYVYECYYYRKYFYDVNDDVLVIKKGVFGYCETTVPFSRIQDIFVDQDILDRMFGLRDVYVSTVTGRSILNAHIDGVNAGNAEKIALLLMEGIKKR